MGELVEINLVGTKNISYEILNYIGNIYGFDNCIKKTEIMDNWNYENLVEVSSLSEIKENIDSKIITMTFTLDNKQLGVYVEKISLGYEHQFWINIKQEFSEKEYQHLCENIINYFSKEFKKYIILCCIGREISIDLKMQLLKDSFDTAHNIDYWIISKRIKSIIPLKNKYKYNVTVL